MESRSFSNEKLRKDDSVRFKTYELQPGEKLVGVELSDKGLGMGLSFDFRFVVATREQFEEAVKQIG